MHSTSGACREYFRSALALLLLAHAPCQHQQLCERRFEPTVTFDLAGNVANDAAEIGAQLLQHPIGALELLGVFYQAGGGHAKT
jgi:hypothetical protein